MLNNNNSNSNTSETVKKSRVEFLSKIASGEYIPSKSKFYMSSGGFYLTHYKHNDSTTDNDKSTFGVDVLAEKGYKIYLESEVSNEIGKKNPDGVIDGRVLEIKTINTNGTFTVKSKLEKSTKQNAEVVVLVQGNLKCDEQYFFRPNIPF